MSDFSPEIEPQLIPETSPVKPGWKNFLQEVLETLGLAILLFVVINIISARVRVDGFSMRTVVGALFVALVMMPGAIYMGLVAGQSLGAAAAI